MTVTSSLNTKSIKIVHVSVFSSLFKSVAINYDRPYSMSVKLGHRPGRDCSAVVGLSDGSAVSARGCGRGWVRRASGSLKLRTSTSF